MNISSPWINRGVVNLIPHSNHPWDWRTMLEFLDRLPREVLHKPASFCSKNSEPRKKKLYACKWCFPSLCPYLNRLRTLLSLLIRICGFQSLSIWIYCPKFQCSPFAVDAAVLCPHPGNWYIKHKGSQSLFQVSLKPDTWQRIFNPHVLVAPMLIPRW